MKQTVFFIIVLLIVEYGSLLAGPSTNFEKGSWEFSGNMALTFQPGYAIFDSEDRKANKGEHLLLLDITRSIGLFPADNYSLQLLPSLFFYHNVTANGDDSSNLLEIGIEVGNEYYFNFGSIVAVALGLDLGMGFVPGLMSINR